MAVRTCASPIRSKTGISNKRHRRILGRSIEGSEKRTTGRG